MSQSIQSNASSRNDPLTALVEHGGVLERSTCGVVVARVTPEWTGPLAFAPQHALLLTLPTSSVDSGATHVTNLTDGITVEAPSDDWLLAFFPEASFETVSGRWQLAANPIPPGVHAAREDVTARHLCLTLLCAPQPDRPLDVLFANSIAKALLAHFLDTYCGSANRRCEPGLRLSPWQLRIAEETMLDRLDQRLPIAAVAARCGVSVVHFSRAFRRTTSETPHRWLMRRRLERACTLLADTDDSISDIALSCGFSDQSHLTRTFTIFLDTTPAVWRQTHRRQRG